VCSSDYGVLLQSFAGWSNYALLPLETVLNAHFMNESVQILAGFHVHCKNMQPDSPFDSDYVTDRTPEEAGFASRWDEGNFIFFKPSRPAQTFTDVLSNT
jgi:hypothetical protein